MRSREDAAEHEVVPALQIPRTCVADLRVLVDHTVSGFHQFKRYCSNPKGRDLLHVY